MNAIAIVENEAFYVEGIKDFHAEVKRHETAAAIAAWYAGDHAKRLIDTFGWSQVRVSQETGIPRASLQRYLGVRGAHRWAGDIKRGETIATILGTETSAQREATTKATRKATFGSAEAEYAVKLYRMTDSPNENEASVAARKLDQFASDHGMTGEEVIEKSRKTLGLTEEMVRDPMDDAIDKMMEPFKKRSKDDLVELLLFCIVEHADLLKKLKERLNG